MFRPISVQLSSTIERDDLIRAGKMLISPWLWRRGEAIVKLSTWFEETFNVDNVVSFNSGRAALFTILKALNIGVGDEVLIQAFTCVAVPNSIRWVGARPVYVDISQDGYKMSISDFKAKISTRTKAVIVQHTFGYPDDVREIRAIAKKKNLYLIEDCAHSLGNKSNGKLLGNFGDVAFFSFGRDKVISGIFGGVAIAEDNSLSKKLKELWSKLKFPSHSWIGQQLLHPLAFSVILPLYKIQLGKIILWSMQKARFLSRPVTLKEYIGKKPANYPQKLPNGLADLALGQLAKIHRFRKQRINHAMLYWQHLQNLSVWLPPNTNQSLLRFPIQVSDPEMLVRKAKKRGIILGRWYSNVVDPVGVNHRRVGYRNGSCSNAEKRSQAVVNLPTAPVLTKGEILEVVSFIKHYYGDKD